MIFMSVTTRPAHWAHHKYERRAVERDVLKFCGWKKLVRLMNKLSGPMRQRNQALFSTIFLTAGRIMEVLPLQLENFSAHDGFLWVEQMPLLKRYEKLGRWIEYVDEKPYTKLGKLYQWNEEKQKWWRWRFHTEKKQEFRRTFPIPHQEPLTPVLLDWLSETEKYLFPGYSKKHLSYIRAYQIITKLGIYPHWLRAQRASCLISFYGWRMEDMMEWAGWEELSTARRYAKMGAEKLAGMFGKTESIKYMEDHQVIL